MSEMKAQRNSSGSSQTRWTPNLVIGQTYRYGWNRMLRKDEKCVLLVIGRRMNSVLVRFEDGYEAVTSATALKKWEEKIDPQPKLW